MKQYKRWLAASLIAMSLSPAAFAASPQEFLLEPMPSWYQEGFSLGYLNIEKMRQAGFSRLEAIEVQNQMKDILEADPAYMELEKQGKTLAMFQKSDLKIMAALQQAIKQVQQDKKIESGFKPEPLQSHEFYVAFDFDETLMAHWYESGQKGTNYYDFKVPTLDFIIRPYLISPDYISMTPGWEAALTTIASIPGCKGILFFTAKEDRASQAVIDKMRIKGQPARQFVKGIFTRNHLVRDQAVIPSKDLRMIDETLTHVVLVDDNPARIFYRQHNNLREFPKYNADAYLKAKYDTKDALTVAYYEALMPTVVRELQEAATHARQHQLSFQDAYYPYSMDGSAEVLALLQQGKSLTAAQNEVRQRRSWFEPKFFFHKP